MKDKKRKFVGGRIVKTCIAAFVTAWICNLLEWPALFAVVTAIVTVEPTAADSIKKGVIRFPAAAIGAGFAMGLESLFGQSAITYALSAALTLIACYKLRLDAGTLVATLTAVAMIPETEGYYLESFFIRLGTTGIGLIVSTIINFAFLPPNFTTTIINNVDELYERCGMLLVNYLKKIEKDKRQFTREYQMLSRLLEKTYQLIQYQREEWKYRRHSISDIRRFNVVLRKLEYFQKILYHIGNLVYMTERIRLSTEESERIEKTGLSIARILQDSHHVIEQEHYNYIDELDILFHSVNHHDEGSDRHRYRHHFSAKMVVIYDLLAIHDIIEDLFYLCDKEDQSNKGKVSK
jgi:uncharacterized membrane protein YgaE (UPF0421/DUF939 family)